VIEKGNLFEIQNSKFKIQNDKEIVILANLPYIPDETFDTNPDQSIKFEPRVAFVG
jgi:methylase of polypeptide subunit release factors